MQRTAARGHCQQVDSHQVEVIRPSFAWVRVDARAPGHNPLTSSAYLRKGQPLNPSDEPTLPPVGTKGACLRKSDEQFGCGEKRLVETPPIGELANPLYDPDLVEAVTNLSIAPPQGKAALNTRSLGRWLLAHRGRPGPFILREGKRATGKPSLWFVESPMEIDIWSAAEHMALNSIKGAILPSRKVGGSQELDARPDCEPQGRAAPWCRSAENPPPPSGRSV